MTRYSRVPARLGTHEYLRKSGAPVERELPVCAAVPVTTRPRALAEYPVPAEYPEPAARAALQ